MNCVSLNLHTARSIRIRRACLNGTWQLQIEVQTENDGRADLTIFAATREALDVEWLDDRHSRITHGESTVEHSDKPFDMLEALKGAVPSSDSAGEKR